MGSSNYPKMEECGDIEANAVTIGVSLSCAPLEGEQLSFIVDNLLGIGCVIFAPGP